MGAYASPPASPAPEEIMINSNTFNSVVFDGLSITIYVQPSNYPVETDLDVVYCLPGGVRINHVNRYSLVTTVEVFNVNK